MTVTVQPQQIVVQATGNGVVVTTGAPAIISGGVSYRHIQSVPAATWTIAHLLGKYPSVTIVDTAGSQVIGDVRFLSQSTVQVSFSTAFSGEAYCN